jgi:hypothetical protein
MPEFCAAVEVYSEGPLSLLVCVPEGMPRGEVEKAVNCVRPSGTDGGWKVSAAATFATGEPHPGPCDKGLAEHTHWLLEA